MFGEHDRPIGGDVTELVMLYDVATEVNEFPGAGLHQVIRQDGPDSGADDDDDAVSKVTADGENPADDGFVYPKTSSVIKVSVTPVP